MAVWVMIYWLANIKVMVKQTTPSMFQNITPALDGYRISNYNESSDPLPYTEIILMRIHFPICRIVPQKLTATVAGQVAVYQLTR